MKKKTIIILSYPMLRYDSDVGQNSVETDLTAKENNIALEDKQHAIF